MKPLIQKLPLNENNSFVAQTFCTPNFEVGWHQHIEYELILFTEGSGLSFVGNHVGEFETGDIYFLGSNLPHSFQKRDPSLIASAVVIQFKGNFWGNDFLALPESRSIKQLLGDAYAGLKITGPAKNNISAIMKTLQNTECFKRILLLCDCLDIIATTKEYITVSTQEIKQLNPKDRECIDRIFQFTIDHFKEPLTLTLVSGIACMSITAFCSYFKRSTKKTYIDFLNEIRIGYACTLLMETNQSVLGICFESGYNTMANFHKQFLKLKALTPLQYRKYYTRQLALPQNNIYVIEG